MTGKQKAFIAEYMVDFNATQAAIRAGYRGESTGHRLIGDGRIRAEIEARVDAYLKAIGQNPKTVLAMVTKVAFGEDTTDANRLKALDMLAKHLGLYAAQKVQHSGSVGLPPVIESVSAGLAGLLGAEGVDDSESDA